MMWQSKVNSAPLAIAVCAALCVALSTAPAALASPVGPPSKATSLSGVPKANSLADAPQAGPRQIEALVGTVNAGTVKAGHVQEEQVQGGQQPLPLVASDPVPLGNAGVYAYRVTDLTLHKARTDPRGGFTFASLPAGVYKIIAHKTGFLPAIVLVTRTAANAFQELQLELYPDDSQMFTEASGTSDFWKIRQRIPADILRDIQIAVDLEQEDLLDDSRWAPSLNSQFNAKMHALTGAGDFAGIADASLVGGHVDLAGHVGDLDVGVVGNFRTLRGVRGQVDQSLGHAQTVALSLRSTESGDFTVSGHQGSLDTSDVAGPIDLERYNVGWRGEVGPGETNVSANYIAEENYYRDPRIDHFELPRATRTLAFAGSYKQSFGDKVAMETGVRYRERVPATLAGPNHSLSNPSERIELFGRGDLTLRESLSLQYGLFTTLRDGSVAFTPQGGVVLELPHNWVAETSIRQRIHQNADSWTDFQPAHYGQKFECTTAEEGCYRLRLARTTDDNSTLEFGALYRTFADTLRLYFSDDLFDELDSLFFVDGDQLPEVHFAYSTRVSSNVLTRFESNLAQGGGGAVRGGYENDVRYMVTSLDTQFEGSETGVLVSFHSLEQRFLDSAGSEAFAPIAKDRLQLLVTQGISRFAGFAPDMDLILDMQVSRSEEQALLNSSDEFSRRILGGIALRF